MAIFIVGNSRSGTTMMGRMLNNHPDVHTFQELHYFDEIISPLDINAMYDKDKSTDIFARLLSIERDGYFGTRDVSKYKDEANLAIHGKAGYNVMELYELFLHYTTGKKLKKIPCEQTPQNIFFTSEILDHVAGAKIVAMVRDPRDVLLSQKNKWKRRKNTDDDYPWIESFRARVNYHPILICKIWKNVIDEITALKDDTRVKIVRYEDLVNNPENVMQDVCRHLEIEYVDGMTLVPKVGSSNKQDSNEFRGVDSSRSGKWNEGGLNAAEVVICQEMLGDKMGVYGYTADKISFNPAWYMWYYLSLPVKVSLAILFNLKRVKDFRRLWRRFIKS
jgi:omega-hydroxy-beta-dihydromenaquinone-9 sulfotransferase